MHTPGPWRVTPSCRIGNGSAWRDILSDGTEFAPSYVGEALDKDAALIAAAPELLEALILLLNVEKAALIGAEAPSLKGLDVPYHFEAARAAIAKAEEQV